MPNKEATAYLEYVYQAAIRHYNERKRQQPYPFAVDLLGHTMIRLTLTQEQIDAAKQYGLQVSEHVTVRLDLSEPLGQIISREDQESRRQSFNANNNDDIDFADAASESASLPPDYFDNIFQASPLTQEMIEAFNQTPKSSIISLGQEAYFHAHLIERMIQAALKKAGKKPTDANRFKQGFEQALQALNTKIIELQIKAINEAYAQSVKRDNKVDLTAFKNALNKALDKARKELRQHIALSIKEGLNQQGIVLGPEVICHMTKELAKQTSATADDYVHADLSTGSISFIGASTHTAHHDGLGAQYTADRLIMTHHLGADNKVQALSARTHVRVPSLAMKKLHKMTLLLLQKAPSGTSFGEDLIKQKLQELTPDIKYSKQELEQILLQYNAVMQAYCTQHSAAQKPTAKQIKKAIEQAMVADTASKIAALQDKYDLAKPIVDSEDEIPQAFIYTLYTTLNKNNLLGFIDEAKNKQGQSAKIIFAAMHEYNRKNPEKLCLVQNIPVNGVGHELSLNDRHSDLLNEATLMTHMASLHTTYTALDDDSKALAVPLFKSYEKFLQQSTSSSFYLYLKSENNQLLEQLKRRQQEYSQTKPTNNLQSPIDIDDVVHVGDDEINIEQHCAAFSNKARSALAALYQQGAFAHHEYSFLYQALTVFIAKASIGGCKSANERTQAINGRVAILDFVSLPQQERRRIISQFIKEPAHCEMLINLANELETAINTCNIKDINSRLNKLYEMLNLEGFQAVVSFIDQGWHSKLGRKGGILPNTNKADLVKDGLYVSEASAGQAQNHLAQDAQDAFYGRQSFDHLKEIKNALSNTLNNNPIGLVLLAALAIALVPFPALSGIFMIAAAVIATTYLIVAAKKYFQQAHTFNESQQKRGSLESQGLEEIERTADSTKRTIAGLGGAGEPAPEDDPPPGVHPAVHPADHPVPDTQAHTVDPHQPTLSLKLN